MPLAAVTHTHTHTSFAILRPVTASSHAALTLVCWLLRGVLLYEHLGDEEEKCMHSVIAV